MACKFYLLAEDVVCALGYIFTIGKLLAKISWSIFYTWLLKIIKIIIEIFNDAPYPWQIAFQDPASPGFVGIFDLHDNIFFYLVLILFGVMWVLGAILFVFKSSSNSLVYKYLSHGTLIEVI